MQLVVKRVTMVVEVLEVEGQLGLVTVPELLEALEMLDLVGQGNRVVIENAQLQRLLEACGAVILTEDLTEVVPGPRLAAVSNAVVDLLALGRAEL